MKIKPIANLEIVKNRIINILDIHSYRKGALAVFMSIVIAASCGLTGCGSDKFASGSLNPENTMNIEKTGAEVAQEDILDSEDTIESEDYVGLHSPYSLQVKHSVDLTNPSVTFKNISTDINNSDIDIIEALEGQKLELSFERLDMAYASFDYPSPLFQATKKEMSQIKEIIKEKVFDDYKVIAYECTDGEFYLGYIKDNELYCLNSFDSELKHYFYSITFHPFENVLGAEKGFVAACILGTTYANYVYYGIYDGIPQVLTHCHGTIYEVDLDGDGMKEIVHFDGMPRYILIQIKRGNDIYKCDLNEHIEDKVYALFGRDLGYTQVLYDEDKNVFEFSTEVKIGGSMYDPIYDSIKGYAIW